MTLQKNSFKLYLFDSNEAMDARISGIRKEGSGFSIGINY